MPGRVARCAPLSIEATIATSDVEAVRLHVGQTSVLPMAATGAYVYRAEIPGDAIHSGQETLQLEVQTCTGTTWFPPAKGHTQRAAGSGHETHELAGRTIEILPTNAPAPLFVAARQPVRLEGQANGSLAQVTGSRQGQRAVRISVDHFDPSPSAVYFRNTIPDAARAWRDVLPQCNVVVVKARALDDATDRVELVLLEKDTAPWGTEIRLTREWQEIVIPLDHLRFFSHWTHPANRGDQGDHFHSEQVSAVNVCFGAWLYGDRANQPHGIELESITLDQRHLP